MDDKQFAGRKPPRLIAYRQLRDFRVRKPLWITGSTEKLVETISDNAIVKRAAYNDEFGGKWHTKAFLDDWIEPTLYDVYQDHADDRHNERRDVYGRDVFKHRDVNLKKNKNT